jgi:hypothetical protein
MRRGRRELGRVGHNDTWVVAMAEATEVVDRPQPTAARGPAEMRHGLSPGGEGLSRKVIDLAREEEAIEVPQDVLNATTPEGAFERNVARQSRAQSELKRSGPRHRPTSA